MTTQHHSSESRSPEKQPCVYIMASKCNGTLYTGVTSDLLKRVDQHKSHLIEGFTKKYNVTQLVWYECHPDMESAILREKRIKEWKRAWKIELIEKANPQWIDLYASLLDVSTSLPRRHPGESREPLPGGVGAVLQRHDEKAGLLNEVAV